MELIKGYKVFSPHWTCEGKQYACPGRFEETAIPSVRNRGMSFCKKASDCFSDYDFHSENKVAEVLAYGTVVKEGNRCYTDKLEIVREIPRAELLTLVNEGKNCTGFRNTGDRNTGNRNTGNRNTGDWNTGDRNTGNRNTGNHNTGSWNTGLYNTGDHNTGYWNTGDRNTGNRNTGDHNTGYWNTGDRNTGNHNTGNRNTGDHNTGYWNTGDWNKASFNNGCFNTIEPTIPMFNKPSPWTYRDWLGSEARYLLNQIPKNVVKWVSSEAMTDEEKAQYPTHETTGGYLKTLDEADSATLWWKSLTVQEKAIIMEIPNFDRAIFKEITGIDVDAV